MINGTTISSNIEEIIKLIYQDYTNIDVSLIDYYNLDLSLFYEELEISKIDMDEIPVSKLPILIEQMGIIIENNQEEKSYIFNMPVIIQFIEYATEKILRKIDEYNIKIQ